MCLYCPVGLLDIVAPTILHTAGFDIGGGSGVTLTYKIRWRGRKYL